VEHHGRAARRGHAVEATDEVPVTYGDLDALSERHRGRTYEGQHHGL
jgi:hypothetical protein